MIITGKKFSKPEMSRVINGDRVLDSAPAEPETFRLDHLLVEKYPGFARATLQSFIKSGRVLVNGEVAKKPNQQFSKDVELSVDFPAVEKTLPPLKVIYEDANVLVVDKPAGLLSMAKGDFCSEPTLEDYGLLVHRLDRDTSGVVILAKTEQVQSFLRRQFQDRKAHKTYYAIVKGRPKLDSALIDLPIARSLKHPTTFVVDSRGKSAQTEYKVSRTNDEFSLLELKPISGRTHQLRVHLKYLGTPIFGDPVYGDEAFNKLHAAKRLYLHATALEISIPDPDSLSAPHLRRTFTSELPADFNHVF